MSHLPRWAGALALVLLPALAAAQTATSVQAPAGFAPVSAPCVKQADKSCVPVAADQPMPVTGVVSTVVQAVAIDRGLIVGTTAVALMAANPARHGWSAQVQSSTASCYVNGSAAATADYHSLLIPPGGYFEPDHHVGTAAISIICTGASTSIYAREW